MSELNDLRTTRELQRWRLILGEAAETTLCGLDDNARQIDHALEWLYGRDPERLQRGERSGGLGDSNLTTPEWINSIHTLFPQRVIERLEISTYWNVCSLLKACYAPFCTPNI